MPHPQNQDQDRKIKTGMVLPKQPGAKVNHQRVAGRMVVAKVQLVESRRSLSRRCIISNLPVPIKSLGRSKKLKLKKAPKFKNQTVQHGHFQLGIQILSNKSTSTLTLIWERKDSKKLLWNEERKLSHACLKRQDKTLKIQNIKLQGMITSWANITLMSWTKMGMQNRTYRFIKALTSLFRIPKSQITLH